jgi:LysR family cys regulon transcriptional activator
MKIRQLEYLREVSRSNLNITLAAARLHTSQPGISKQIRLLESELGVELFVRNGKHLAEVTPAGKAVLKHAERLLHEAANIRTVAADHDQSAVGSLSIATTHTQARYVLPDVVEQFRARFPKVRLNIHQGSPGEIANLLAQGVADLAIVTELLDPMADLVLLPCYRWNRSVLVPLDHPLRGVNPLTLADIAQYPLITYVFGLTARSDIKRAFASQGLDPEVVLTALDTEIIKTYVRLGMGVGIAATLAYDPVRDNDLIALDAGHLFESAVACIALRHRVTLRHFVYDFVQLFAPHLSPNLVDQSLIADAPARQQLFNTCLLDLEERRSG